MGREMSEKLSMRKIREILRLKWECGHSNRDIAISANISASTVGNYLRRATQCGLSWPLDDSWDEATLWKKLFGEPTRSTSVLADYDWQQVRNELSRKGVTLQLLWYEYKTREPKGVSYTRFCEHYRRWRKNLDVCLRQHYKAGEKLLVDYSGLTMSIILDSHTGEHQQAEIFVGVMGASNKIYVEACATQSLKDWLGAHVNMFEFFGGLPDILIPDNLKSGVKSPDLYEPDLNPSYQDLAEHYGVAVIPTRVASPKDKAKVEQAVQHIGRRILAPLRHRQFFSIHELNQAIKLLLAQVNAAPFQKLEGSRDTEFEKLDKPALKPLPSQRYGFAQWKKAKVNLDYHIELDRHYYSVPYRYVRTKVDIRYSQNIVEIFKGGQRIAAHRRSYQKGAHTTLPEHMPRSHREYLGWDTNRILNWAGEQGESVATLSEAIINSKRHPQQGYRACFGLMRLKKTYGNQRLNAACYRALHIGAHSYQSVKSILKNELDRVPLPEPQKDPTHSEHEYVRGANYFQ